MEMSEEFLNWCENKWENEFKAQNLFSKLSNEDIDFLKDQYEARLKADLVALLEDLDLQINESAAYNLEVAKVQRLIRDRIDKLREGENDGNVE